MPRRMDDTNSKCKSGWIPTKAVYVQTLIYFDRNTDSWEVMCFYMLVFLA